MAIHEEESPLAGATVILTDGTVFVVTDWWDRVWGKSWCGDDNTLSIEYASRRELNHFPADDNVLYGHHPHGKDFLVNTCEIVNFQLLS